MFGSPSTTSGVLGEDVLVSNRFQDATANVKRLNARLMKVVAEQRMYHFISSCEPLTGCSERVKDEFWAVLDAKTAKVPSEDSSFS